MSKIINITAKKGVMITLKNVYAADRVIPSEEALVNLQKPLAEDDIWNTGLATLGDPHINEILDGQKFGEGNAAILKDKNPWIAKHIVAVNLFRTNSFVYLLPGDSITIEAESAEAAAYYAMLRDENLEVTAADVVTEGAARPEAEFDGGKYLGRTTGIGDADDGNDANGVYPFEFKTEVTKKATGDDQQEGQG